MEWFKFYHNKFLTDLAIGRLSPVDRLCFITCLCLAAGREERDGCIPGLTEEELIALTRLPNPRDASGVLDRLVNLSLLKVRIDGTFEVTNFVKRQETNLTEAERSKRYRSKSRDERHARVDKIREDKKRKEQTRKEETGFELFWSCYPKKTAKVAARKAWGKIEFDEVQAVVEGVEMWKRTDQWKKDNGQFIPHPSTFLNQRRWEDELPTQAKDEVFKAY